MRVQGAEVKNGRLRSRQEEEAKQECRKGDWLLLPSLEKSHELHLWDELEGTKMAVSILPPYHESEVGPWAWVPLCFQGRAHRDSKHQWKRHSSGSGRHRLEWSVVRWPPV